MVSTGSFMDFSKEGNPIFLRYAPLKHPRSASLVELTVDYREGLGMPHDLSAVDGIFWEFAPCQVGQVWPRPYRFDEHDYGCILREICRLCCWSGVG
jgi:hypothetical protein